MIRPRAIVLGGEAAEAAATALPAFAEQGLRVAVNGTIELGAGAIDTDGDAIP
jgi:hypothetical protein